MRQLAAGNTLQSTKEGEKKTIEYYAIKSVDKAQKSRVLQEVRTLHSLDHSNVLKFYAWYETSAHLWLVLEYCVGGDLLTLLRQDSRLPEESVHDFAYDLVQALQFLHSKGVIYCDLKPSNILLDENGRLKLCDFGLARRLSDISKNSVQQLPQAKRGTPCYMAPELFQEGGVHSFASDLWAVGCVLYECYAGRPPFVSSSFTQLVNSILTDVAPGLQGTPSKEFQDLISRLLIKDPAKRLQWTELCQHPFWKARLRCLPLPPQPAFANSMRLLQHGANRGLDHSAHGTCVTGQKNIHQDQHTSRPEKLVRKAETYAGQRKTSITPSRPTDACENTPVSKHSNSARTPNVKDYGPAKEDSGQRNCGVNLLRLSRIVKTNLQRETEGGNYRQQGSHTNGNDTDVMIVNHDLELDFAEQAESDLTDEEESAEVSSSCPEKVSACKETAPLKHDRDQTSACKAQELLSDESDRSVGNDSDHEKGGFVKTTIQAEIAATPPGVGLRRKAQRTPVLAEQRKGTLNFTTQVSSDSKHSLIGSQILWHASDLTVRPIMPKKTERLNFESAMLPFDPVSSSDFVKFSSEEMEVFVNKIVNSVSGSMTLAEKINALKYLETLCTSVDGANVLINGPVMHMLVRMLRTPKTTTLHVQILSVMGLLIRHATIIEEELASSGIIAVLSEGLRDKQDKVRRSSMAALGELLFYIANQNESSPRSGTGMDNSAKEGRSSSTWQIPSTLIALVSSILRKGEDDIIQQHALRTIENISSQGGDWVIRFSNHEVLENLCYIFKASSKQENIRLTAGSCLVRLVRFSSSNTGHVLEKLNLKDLLTGLTKGSPREQQVNLNLFNMCLAASTSGSNISKHLIPLMDERTLVSTLTTLLEQSTEVVRGKAFICVALLCKINRRWLSSLCSTKLLAAIDRLSKEKDPYVQQCMEMLVQAIVETVPGILNSIGSEVQQLASGKRLTMGATHASPAQSGRTQFRSSLSLFPVILQLFDSAIFRERTINGPILKQLAGFLNYIQTASFQGLDEFRSNLLRIFDVIGQQNSVPLAFPEVFFPQVLPSLTMLYKRNCSGDTRFLCLKIFFDVLVVYLEDISEDVSKGDKQTGNSKQNDLSSIARNHFLPYYPSLMDDDDPIPMYAQKLLVMLLDTKCIDISDILHLKLISQFFDFLWEDFSTVNLHNVRLSLFLSSSSQVDTCSLSKLGISGRVGALLEFVNARDMEDFLEPILLLCRSLLVRCPVEENGNFKVQTDTISDIAELIKFSGVFLELCCRHEPPIVEGAAECLLLAVKTVPKEAALIITSKLSLLRNALESSCTTQCSKSASKLQLSLLVALSAVCSQQRITQERLSGADITSLERVVSRLKGSNLQAVADAAVDAGLELQVLSAFHN